VVDLESASGVLAELALADATIQVRREADGTVQVGAFSIRPAPAESPPSEQGKPWDFGIDRLLLKNLRIDYQDPELVGSLVIREVRMLDSILLLIVLSLFLGTGV